METKDQSKKREKDEQQPDNVVQLPDAKARVEADEPGQSGKSERGAGEPPKQPKGASAINTVCQTTFQVLTVVQPLLTLLAAKKEQLGPVKDVVDAIQEALSKHVGPEQGERILSAITKEIRRLRPKDRTPEELDALLKSITKRIGALARKHLGEEVTK